MATSTIPEAWAGRWPPSPPRAFPFPWPSTGRTPSTWALPVPDILLSEGDIVAASGLRVLHTPGHSPGSICLVEEGGKLAYTGDTLFCGGIGRADFPDASPEDLVRSLTRLLSLLDGKCRCWPGHGRETFAGDEKAALFP